MRLDSIYRGGYAWGMSWVCSIVLASLIGCGSTGPVVKGPERTLKSGGYPVGVLLDDSESMAHQAVVKVAETYRKKRKIEIAHEALSPWVGSQLTQGRALYLTPLFPRKREDRDVTITQDSRLLSEDHRWISYHDAGLEHQIGQTITASYVLHDVANAELASERARSSLTTQTYAQSIQDILPNTQLNYTPLADSLYEWTKALKGENNQGSPNLHLLVITDGMEFWGAEYVLSKLQQIKDENLVSTDAISIHFILYLPPEVNATTDVEGLTQAELDELIERQRIQSEQYLNILRSGIEERFKDWVRMDVFYTAEALADIFAGISEEGTQPEIFMSEQNELFVQPPESPLVLPSQNTVYQQFKERNELYIDSHSRGDILSSEEVMRDLMQDVYVKLMPDPLVTINASKYIQNSRGELLFFNRRLEEGSSELPFFSFWFNGNSNFGLSHAFSIPFEKLNFNAVAVPVTFLDTRTTGIVFQPMFNLDSTPVYLDLDQHIIRDVPKRLYAGAGRIMYDPIMDEIRFALIDLESNSFKYVRLPKGSFILDHNTNRFEIVNKDLIVITHIPPIPSDLLPTPVTHAYPRSSTAFDFPFIRAGVTHPYLWAGTGFAGVDTLDLIVGKGKEADNEPSRFVKEIHHLSFNTSTMQWRNVSENNTEFDTLNSYFASHEIPDQPNASLFVVEPFIFVDHVGGVGRSILKFDTWDGGIFLYAIDTLTYESHTHIIHEPEGCKTLYEELSAQYTGIPHLVCVSDSGKTLKVIVLDDRYAAKSTYDIDLTQLYESLRQAHEGVSENIFDHLNRKRYKRGHVLLEISSSGDLESTYFDLDISNYSISLLEESVDETWIGDFSSREADTYVYTPLNSKDYRPRYSSESRNDLAFLASPENIEMSNQEAGLGLYHDIQLEIKSMTISEGHQSRYLVMLSRDFSSDRERTEREIMPFWVRDYDTQALMFQDLGNNDLQVKYLNFSEFMQGHDNHLLLFINDMKNKKYYYGILEHSYFSIKTY